MIRTVTLNADIPDNRELHISLPADIPAGPAEIVVVVSPVSESSGCTLGDFANSEFYGMWQGREDITDSAAFARSLRIEGWKRIA